MSKDNNVIEVTDLRRSYGEIEALRGVSFTVARGEIFCLLGPNGAGKTTATEILEGYRASSGGTVRVLGHDPAQQERDLHERLGIVLQETGVQGALTVRELLEMYGGWYARPRDAGELIALVGLEGKEDARAEELSGGQRRRLDLALALVGSPELLFLDEPTTGFDPEARRRAWKTIRDLADHGTTIFLTTHFMDEAQFLADRVAVMAAGEIVALGPPNELAGREDAPGEIRFLLPEGAGSGDIPRPTADTTVVIETDGTVLVRSADAVEASYAVLSWARASNHELRGFSVTRPSLEDVYLQLVATPAEEVTS